MMSKSRRVRSLPGWLRAFACDQTGLATVEWVALAGAVVIGGVFVAFAVLRGLQPAGNAVGSQLTQCESSAPQNSGSSNCE